MDKKWWIVLFLVAVVALILWVVRKRENFEEEGIPKIIHQTAPSDESKWDPKWKECQQSWKDLHPDFEYRFWSDEDIDTFMRDNYPDFYENVFTKYDVKIKRIDAFRYFLLKHFGGVYADMDFMCQKRFFEELPPDKVSISEPPWTNGSGTTYENALMISAKGHPFWDSVIEGLYRRKDEPFVLETTGPALIIECVKNNKDQVHTLASEEYDPDPENQSTAKTFHMRTGVWTNGYSASHSL